MNKKYLRDVVCFFTTGLLALSGPAVTLAETTTTIPGQATSSTSVETTVESTNQTTPVEETTLASTEQNISRIEETTTGLLTTSEMTSESSSTVTVSEPSTETTTVATTETSQEATEAKQEGISTAVETSLYRLYHPGLKVHLYTKDANEYRVLAGRGWKQEGVAWRIVAKQGDVVYRLYHPGLKVHLYTKDANEYKVLAGRGWKQEGEAYRSYGNLPIYRLYHPGLRVHLYTKDANEYKVLAGRGWKQEGVAFYGFGSSSALVNTGLASDNQATGTLSISNINRQSGSFDVVATNVQGTSSIKSVQIAVWSETNGQDDLRWYTASRQSNGSYRVTIANKNHNYSVGNYQVHLYYQYTNGQSEGIATTVAKLPQAIPAGTIRIQNQNNAIGTFDVLVSNVTNPGGINTVLVPVWSEENGQDDLRWYEAKKQANGQYKVSIQARDHGYSTGRYQAHLYFKQADGTTIGVPSTASTIVEITDTTPKAKIRIEAINKTYGIFDVRVSDVYAPLGVDSVQIPVWSDVNGQNDLYWYTAVKQADGSYLATVRVGNHKYEQGVYNAHLYISSQGKQYGVAQTSATITYTKKELPQFVDVSSHNGSLSVADYRTLVTKGVSGVVVKLSEGVSYRNPYAEMQIKNALSAGLKVSVYHYSHFTTKAEAKAEAQYFVATAKRLGLPASTLMVNDIEEYKTRVNINENMKAWEEEMRRLGYTNLIHYTGASWLDKNSLGIVGPIQTGQFGLSNFWVAQYLDNTLSSTQAMSLVMHSRAAAWQFTSRAELLRAGSYFDLNIDYTGRFTQ